MYEVEMKVRAEHEPVRDRLETLGAKRQDVVSQVDTYYDPPDRDFAETDEALRVRREEGKTGGELTTKVTYKGPLVEPESKTREEAEMVVSWGSDPRAVLEGLGYEPAATVEKERERYLLDGVTVALDTVAGLGAFVEVELETEDDIEAARKRAVQTLETLGLDPSDQIRTSYLDLLLEA